MTWHQQAACGGIDVCNAPDPADCTKEHRNPFFIRSDEDEAFCRDLCRTCPVIVDCAKECWNFPSSVESGFRAGTTPEQRSLIRSGLDIYWDNGMHGDLRTAVKFTVEIGKRAAA